MRVAIFGLGYVGSVTAACLAHGGHSVIGVDTDPVKLEALSRGQSPIVEPGLGAMIASAVEVGALEVTSDAAFAVQGADISVVCVGTPSAKNGSADLSYLLGAIEDIGRALPSRQIALTVVVRSTVPPGTIGDVVTGALEKFSDREVGRDLQVAMCPEFLREGSGISDFYDPPFIALGLDAGPAEHLCELFEFIDRPVHIMSVRDAESLKYVCNAFHALKVSFTNDMSRLLRALGVDARRVMDIFVQDDRLNISPAYLRPGFAFGGSCLPKDLRTLLYLARANDTEIPLIGATIASNEITIRELATRVLEAALVEGGSHRSVALLGLSFKSETDDLRESPSVALAELLIGKGIEVRIHDPIINPLRLFGSNRAFVQARLPHLHRLLYRTPAEALRGVNVVVLVSDDRAIVQAVVEADPEVVFDLQGRTGSTLEALRGYQGAAW